MLVKDYFDKIGKMLLLKLKTYKVTQCMVGKTAHIEKATLGI
jgi:hypothetical protein